MNITVYLGSYEGNDESIRDAVRELGHWIGESGNALVYGGSKIGLMGVLAESVIESGGKATGVEPAFFVGLIDAPCIIYNHKGYYDSLRAQLDEMTRRGLSSEERQKGIFFAESIGEIIEILENTP